MLNANLVPRALRGWLNASKNKGALGRIAIYYAISQSACSIFEGDFKNMKYKHVW
jgi:hypothetical protein